VIEIPAWRLWACLAAVAACVGAGEMRASAGRKEPERNLETWTKGAGTLAACRDALERDEEDMRTAAHVCAAWRETAAWYQKEYLRIRGAR
jgi:hypothetical protein